MLQYLIILLDEQSISYCHYTTKAASTAETGNTLMPLDTLRAGIRFAMKENLNIQFVYPERELPEGWKKEIETIDHSNIRPAAIAFERDEKDVLGLDKTDVAIVDGWQFPPRTADIPIVIRTTMEQLFLHYKELEQWLAVVPRVSVVLTDVPSMDDENLKKYGEVLDELTVVVERLYAAGKSPQLNLLTDRMMLSEMNNCGAGDTSLTLAPNGRFYVCPAFYYENAEDYVGDLTQGLNVRNKKLYQLDYAPICRHCDAWQCKRCVWLNREMTLEVNTPSRQQCVMAHLERNASRRLLAAIRRHGTFLPENEIEEIDYLDPFEKRTEW